MTSVRAYLAAKHDGLCNFLESDSAATQLTIYGTSALLLAAAYLKRKPTHLVRKFKKLRHLPQHLLNERTIRTGCIADIEQRGQDTLLLVKRHSWLSLFGNDARLTAVKLPGVQVSANGYSWLQSCLIGHKAILLPLQKAPKSRDTVASQVCLVDTLKPGSVVDVAETLLKLRFAKFAQDDAAASKRNAKYYAHLRAVEERTKSAATRANWSAYLPPLQRMLDVVRKRLLPNEQKLPELVR